MQRVSVGMKVNAVNDARVGEARLVNSCCMVVEADGQTLFLRPDSIFNVANGVVTLMCVKSEVSRYACPVHARPQLPETLPAP